MGFLGVKEGGLGSLWQHLLKLGIISAVRITLFCGGEIFAERQRVLVLAF